MQQFYPCRYKNNLLATDQGILTRTLKINPNCLSHFTSNEISKYIFTGHSKPKLNLNLLFSKC